MLTLWPDFLVQPGLIGYDEGGQKLYLMLVAAIAHTQSRYRDSAPRIDGLCSLLFYNPVFSAAQCTIFSTLTQGGCLCLASKESQTVALAETINKMDVNTIGVTSSTALLLTPETVPSLKRMTLIGEKVGSAVVKLWEGKLDLQAGYSLSGCTQLNWRANIQPEGNPNKVGRNGEEKSRDEKDDTIVVEACDAPDSEVQTKLPSVNLTSPLCLFFPIHILQR
ncbi:hypothetical protein JB92DRAFT_3189596 [Gautieria morchelliformis]|nr:hypothetical protein JB92DRAFT_3189596 [Gautieria morchelliformis]